MSSVVTLYEALTEAPDDQTRARVIAQAFESLEERFPRLSEMATQGHVRESELRLQKEIEQVRAEIEQVRSELRQSELRLQKEIELVRAELKTDISLIKADISLIKADISLIKADLLKWLVPLMFGQVVAIAALVKLL
jgi:hypothetical protein